MSRKRAALVAVLMILAPAGVATAADASGAAAVSAPPLTQAEAKRLTDRMNALSREIIELQDQASRASRAAYRSSFRREPQEVTEAFAAAAGRPLRYAVIPSGYSSMIITDTNGLAGFKAGPANSSRPAKSKRALRLEQKIAAKVLERDLIRARLAADQGGA